MTDLPRLRTTTSTSSNSVDSLRLQASVSTSTSSRLPLHSSTSGMQISQLTVEAALQAANNDPMQALETVVTERNTLSAQNAQLWKLIEKQRSGYANALRELERVRAERDQARGRRGTAPASSSVPSGAEETALSQQKPVPERQSSEDNALSQRNLAVTRTPALSPSRSHDRLSPSKSGAASVSTPNLNASTSSSSSQTTSISPTLPLASESAPSLGLSLNAVQPLHINKERHSPAASTPPISATAFQPPIIVAPPPLNTFPTSPSPVHQTSLTVPAPSPIRTNNKLSRESTISLPPEARQYIANMADSPVPSPQSNLSRPASPEKPAEPSPGPACIPLPPVAPIVEDVSPSPENEVRSSAPDPEPEHERPSTPHSIDNAELATPIPDHPVVEMDDDASSMAPSLGATEIEGEPSKLSTPYDSDHDASYENIRDPISEVSSRMHAAVASHGIEALTYHHRRLSEADLPLTRVKVLTSTIRSNGRGKDEQSFMISVEPRNKGAWRVEKLYSNVLSLDDRLRSYLNKNQLKNIASLPDSKLFKDNAPAKADQRKAVLEHYLQSVIYAPVKNKAEICEFFSSNIIKEMRGPVTQMGYKEGYLTKRGKNFGGWKTRYFVLQGPVLEYYENRGGTHLGSINITNAQIGRQQRSTQRESEDENEYRHAFLIIEAKRGPGGQHTRHVLCADSDADRDSWVDVLVRYVNGSYDDTAMAMTASSAASSQISSPPPRFSNDSGFSIPPSYPQPHIPKKSNRQMNKDDISKGPAIPISQLPLDIHTAKLFQTAPIPSSSVSIMKGAPSGDRPILLEMQRRAIERAESVNGSENSDVPLSSSLPSGSSMEVAEHSNFLSTAPRSNSEMGHYSDLHDQPSLATSSTIHQTPTRAERGNRQSYMPTLGVVQASPTNFSAHERPITPDPIHSQTTSTPNGHRGEQAGKPKISGPMNGIAIPPGFKFGAKDPPPHDSTLTVNDRDRKARSTTFKTWKFGRGEKPPGVHVPAVPHRAVFGVPLQESLAVAEIANLPAVIFRCIEYLQAKKADQEEGIYRLSGSSAVVKSLKDRFNAEGDVNLLKSDEQWDPHAIAGLLKLFLRELPSSILTRDLHMRFLGVMDSPNAERVSKLSHLVSRLPFENYSLLRALIAHLILVVQNANANKMTVRNLGIVFSPSLGLPAGVFNLMFGEFNRVFNVDGESTESTEESEPTEIDHDTPSTKRLSVPSRRNSRNYQESAADQLLGFSGRTLTTTVEGQSDADEDVSASEVSSPDTDDIETDPVPTLDSQSQSNEGTPPPNTPHESINSIVINIPHDLKEEATPTRPTRSSARAANVAADRGLQIATDHHNKRYSRQVGVVGLPHSPRPPHHQDSSSSPPSLHTYGSAQNTPK